VLRGSALRPLGHPSGGVETSHPAWRKLCGVFCNSQTSGRAHRRVFGRRPICPAGQSRSAGSVFPVSGAGLFHSFPCLRLSAWRFAARGPRRWGRRVGGRPWRSHFRGRRCGRRRWSRCGRRMCWRRLRTCGGRDRPRLRRCRRRGCRRGVDSGGFSRWRRSWLLLGRRRSSNHRSGS
jgi:hypothetical protein